MPKSRKRHQKNSRAKAPASGRAGRALISPVQIPTFSDFSFSREIAVGEATDEDWQELRDALLADYPICPDCETPWDLNAASEEEGVNFDGSREISITVLCPAYEADEDAGREPRQHRRTDDGVIRHSLALP
jgi:hypothetical protein